MKDYENMTMTEMAFEIYKALLAGHSGIDVNYLAITKRAYDAAEVFDHEAARRWEERHDANRENTIPGAFLATKGAVPWENKEAPPTEAETS